MSENVIVTPVNAADPSLRASNNPASVEKILRKPPSQAHHGACANLAQSYLARCAKGNAKSNPARPVTYTANPANTG